jgi:hypothetical protein
MTDNGAENVKSGRLLPILRYLLFLASVIVLIFLVLEGGLRLFTEYPSGRFRYTPRAGNALYRPSAEFVIDIMPIPYRVRTNALGFRGPEIMRQKPPDTIRIIALGDSCTDGYMTDNADTWPFLLERSCARAAQRQRS